MKKPIQLLLSSLCICANVQGAPLEGLSFDENGKLMLETEVGRTYFLESSSDLKIWRSENDYCVGDGAVHEEQVEIAGDNAVVKFYRYRAVETNGSAPHDSDGDGITNLQELIDGTNPTDDLDPLGVTDPVDPNDPNEPTSPDFPSDPAQPEAIDNGDDGDDQSAGLDELADPADVGNSGETGDDPTPYDVDNPEHPDYNTDLEDPDDDFDWSLLDNDPLDWDDFSDVTDQTGRVIIIPGFPPFIL